jgi:hypothetical protein
MANKESGERTLQLGDERLTLKFTASAYIELEDVLGYSAGQLEQNFRDQAVGWKELRALIWAGSRRHHRREIRTLPEITELMDEIPDQEGGYALVWETVTEAYAAGQGNAPDQDGNEADSPQSRRERRAKAKAEPASTGNDS